MTVRRRDDLPPELLAAFVDGELNPRDRADVEDWLVEHPEAHNLLDTQEALAPGNTDFWSAVRPPEPTPAEWANTLEGIGLCLPSPPQRSRFRLLGPIGLLATAATILVALPALNRPRSTEIPDLPGVVPAASLEVTEPFVMASAEDVRIISLPESAADLLVVGEHPLRDPLLLLARADEIEFHAVGSDLAGQQPEIPSDLTPDAAPMIWAPRAP